MERINGYAYKVSLKNGWLKDYTWFLSYYEAQSKVQTKWTYEKCYNEALKYQYLNDFQKYSASAYNRSRKQNWLKDFTWLKRLDSPYTSNMDNVYAYFFNTTNTVYIGRSIEPIRRNKYHHKTGSVYNYATQNGFDIPEMVILESNLSLEDGLIYEDLYVEQYKNDGWNVINKGKTGLKSGSLGAISHTKWSYNKTFELAKQCHSIKELERLSSAAYKNAKANNWFKDYTWFTKTEDLFKRKHPDRVKWTYEACKNAALNCNGRGEFAKRFGYAYNLSWKSGWLDDFFPKTKKAA